MGWKRRTRAERLEKAVLITRWADIRQVTGAIRLGQPAAIDRAIAFLLEDPRYHGSGYLKEIIWRRLANASLTPKQRARLEEAAVALLDKRVTREFWTMARAHSRTGTAAFWDDVRVALNSPSPAVRRRATALLAYESGVQAGERAKRKLKYGR